MSKHSMWTAMAILISEQYWLEKTRTRWKSWDFTSALRTTVNYSTNALRQVRLKQLKKTFSTYTVWMNLVR